MVKIKDILNESVDENIDAQIKSMMDRRERMKKSGASTSAINSVTQMIKKLRDRKRKSNESVDENMYDMSVFNLAVSHMGKFEKDFKRLIKSANVKDKKKALELMKVYKKHWIEFSVKVKDILKYD